MKAEVHPWEQALDPYFFSVGIKHGVSLEQIPHFIWQLLGEIDGMLFLVALGVLVEVM
jgi:hypothetical protein